ncbi:hypothetical protein Godav_024665, partial [Gossypium davidsonii]|nr:hypothetical protein [Gossypium davidsonii]
KDNSGFATIGGVLRDKYSRWILGFNWFVVIFSILNAKLWGIQEGLAIALDRGFNRLIIFYYSQEVVQVPL